MLKHSKRFVLVFKIEYGEPNYLDKNKDWDIKWSESYDEFDTLQEANQGILEYTELYKDDPEPIYYPEHYKHKLTGKEKLGLYDWRDKSEDYDFIKEAWDYTEGKKFWGWLLLDFEKCTIERTGGCKFLFYPLVHESKTSYHYRENRAGSLSRHKEASKNIKNDLSLRDYFFRGDNEIPKDYKWDDGEYEGWLQFRWGNGKNSLTYIEPPKPQKETAPCTAQATPEERYDAQTEFDLQLDRENKMRLRERW